MASECGNTSLLAAHPTRDMLLTTVAKHGLWASTDGGASWQQLWPTAGMQQITNRGSSFVFDPAHPMTFWESGIYNGPGVYRTTDDGATFSALGDAHHIDSVSVDLGDPQRQTLLAGGHEQKQTLYRSADGGDDLDERRRQPAHGHELLHQRARPRQEHPPRRLLGLRGRHRRRLPHDRRRQDLDARHDGVRRRGRPCGRRTGRSTGRSSTTTGLIKSTDQGKTWTQTIKGGTSKTGHPIELPDGRIVAPGPKTLMISTDKGDTFQPVGAMLPFAPEQHHLLALPQRLLHRAVRLRQRRRRERHQPRRLRLQGAVDEGARGPRRSRSPGSPASFGCRLSPELNAGR